MEKRRLRKHTYLLLQRVDPNLVLVIHPRTKHTNERKKKKRTVSLGTLWVPRILFQTEHKASGEDGTQELRQRGIFLLFILKSSGFVSLFSYRSDKIIWLRRERCGFSRNMPIHTHKTCRTTTKCGILFLYTYIYTPTKFCVIGYHLCLKDTTSLSDFAMFNHAIVYVWNVRRLTEQSDRVETSVTSSSNKSCSDLTNSPWEMSLAVKQFQSMQRWYVQGLFFNEYHSFNFLAF